MFRASMFQTSARVTGRLRLAALAAVLTSCAVLASAVVSPVDARPSQEQMAASADPRPPEYGVHIERQVPVQMSDGVVLRADVYYPADLSTGGRAEGRFPVLLSQNPYSSAQLVSGPVAGTFDFFPRRGYIFILTQVRGTGTSEGEYCFLCEREQQDGVELVNWAARELSGSNGKVGLAGCSYLGVNQYFTAARVGADSPLKAIAPGGNGSSVYRSSVFLGGVPTETLLVFNAATPYYGADGVSLVAEIEAGGDAAYDGDYWQERMPANYAENIVRNGIPALITAHWSDVHVSTTAEMYAMLQNAFYGRDIWEPMRQEHSTTPRYQFIMYPGPHCDGYYENPDVLEWFDTWLMGQETGQANDHTMRLYELGSDRWVETSAYPFVDRYTPYYLHNDGSLRLSAPTSSAGSDSLAFGGGSLTYETDPFEDGATIAGPMSLSLYASSTTRNMLLTADLLDVAPDGTVTRLITTGGLIGSMRELDPDRTWRDKSGNISRPYQPFAADDYLTPGVLARFDIELRNRLVSVPPGHRIRLIVKSVADCNEMVSNPGQFRGVGPCLLVPTLPQNQTLAGGVYDIRHNSQWPSHLSVPLLPYLYDFGTRRPQGAPPPGKPVASGAEHARQTGTSDDDNIETAVRSERLPATGSGTLTGFGLAAALCAPWLTRHVRRAQTRRR